MRLQFGLLCMLVIGVSVLASPAVAQSGSHTVMAVFAHPDDERIVGPLLARLAREGDRVVWVVSTDGSKGVTSFAKIPAGPELAAVRARESRCAAEKLGIPAPIMLGLEDGGLASFDNLGRLRRELNRLVAEYRPEVLLTIGPEGGTGHPDHRLVGNVITEVVQGLTWANPPALYYASLPTERMKDAPLAGPHLSTLPEKYLPVQIAFTPQDLAAGAASFNCHESQYTQADRTAVNRMLAYGWDGSVYLRPWLGSVQRTTELFSSSPRAANATPPAGFTSAFNGRDLSGWRGRPGGGGTFSPYVEAAFTPAERAAKRAEWNADRDAHWSVDKSTGELVSDGHGVHLATEKPYGDFEMKLDWKLTQRCGDSGVYLRDFPQVQIWDPACEREQKNGADRGSGGLWNNNPDNPGRWPLVKADNPIGEWNTMDIRMVGTRVWVTLNGKQVVVGQVLDNVFDRSKPVLPTGSIELQTHGSEVRFRNIYLREIPAAEAKAILAG